MEILLKAIIVYIVCATILLLNLLFNKNVTWKYINKETGEVREVPCFITIGICFYWIVTIPMILLQRRKNNEPRS